MDMWIIKNMTMSKYEWVNSVSKKKPDFTANDEYYTDIISLDFSNPQFADSCQKSCILIFKVYNGETRQFGGEYVKEPS